MVFGQNLKILIPAKKYITSKGRRHETNHSLTTKAHLLLGQLFGDDSLINGPSLLPERLLGVLDVVALDVARTHQHTLESTQTKVIVRLAGELLVTQPACDEGGEGVR